MFLGQVTDVRAAIFLIDGESAMILSTFGAATAEPNNRGNAMNDKHQTKAIAANIEALRDQLKDCANLSDEALQAIQNGEPNQAIGCILDFGRKLEDALALYRAAVVLHREGVSG